jgi:3',5'-cyclic AMP phosphodiesterase CpdA
VVFDDADRDGLRGPGEVGIAGVKVSNGLEVVHTDAEGRYRLSIDDDTILFVIKPRDWMTPTDELGLPRFYTIHKPAGSPDRSYRYPGVAPTGPLPDSVDFPLHHRPEPERFEVVVLGDPQPASREDLAFLGRDTIAELVGSDAAFGISLGDLVGNDLDLFQPLNELQGLVGIPWYNLPGNHDLNFLAESDEHADESFERVYGPSTYAFQHARVHFVVLDDVLWNGFTSFEKSGRPDNDNYEGGLRPDQLAFLKNYLDTVPLEDLVVLAMHIPLEKGDAPPVRHQREILELLSGRPHTLSISGHTHLQQHVFFGAEDGFRFPGGSEHHHFNAGTASGGWYRGPRDEVGVPIATMKDGTPKGHSILDFDGVSYSIRYQVNRRPADYQMNVFAPDRVDRAEAAGTEVLVNVFAGSERSRVEMRVGPGSPWVQMVRDPRPDPFLLEWGRIEQGLALRPWRELPAAKPSTHLWVAPIPEGLPPGTHLIEVRTTDMFGQSYGARRPIRVE